MINKRIRDLMNEQVKHELESAYIYLSMVAYFEAQNLQGFAHWMRVQVHEETIHAMKFFGHIIDRGGEVELLDLRQLKKTWKSPLEAFHDAYEHEQFITGKINTIMAAVRQENEFAAEPLLNWFVNEQIEEEANTSKISKQLEMIGNSNEGLVMLDKELSLRIFAAVSPYDPTALLATQQP